MKILNIIKKGLKQTDKTMTILIVVGILIVINFLSYQISLRWDLTQNKDYSISTVSKDTVRNLEDIINIKVYFSKNLPNDYITLEQEVKDILDEYVNYSNGNVKVVFIDPTTVEEQEIYAMGIPPVQFNVLEKDKYEIVKGFLGIVVQYGDKTEVIPVVQNTRNFEYQITTAIKKTISDEIATVGVVSSHGSASLQVINFAHKKLQELYLVLPVDLENEEISSDINTLILVGPKSEFDEEALKKLDEFLMRGGSLLALVDGVKIAEGLVATSNDTKLASLLEEYGIKLNNDLVMDVSSGMAQFSSGFFSFSSNYPFWPKILKAGFDQEMPSVAKLESALLPWASSLEIIENKIDANANATRLVQTSPKSWTQKDTFNLNPQQRFVPGNDLGEKLLAVSVFGKINSAYSEKTIDNGRLVVVSDSDFVLDNFLQQNPDNLIFFQNLVDSLSLDNDLINIRSKGISDRPLTEISEGQKATVRYLNIFGLTVVVIIIGLVRYYLRRKSKFIDEI